MVFATDRLIALIPLVPLAAAALLGVVGSRLPRRLVSLAACGSVLAAFAAAIAVVMRLAEQPAGTVLSVDLYRWLESGALAVDLRFVVDRLSAVMLLVVSGVAFLIHLYSVGYMAHEPSYARYFAYLNLFTGAMLLLVLGDSLPVVFVGWEGVGLCSYLLIGFWYSDSDKVTAGRKAFIVNRIGDVGFVLAMLLLLRVAGTLSFDGLRAAMQAQQLTVAATTGACLLLLLGACGKSAQIPLYIWLPDAMAGPTPVSALIHAATMVTAGVYMVARLGFLFAAAPVAMLTVASIGALTAVFAASIATVQHDIKKVLAYSTISQLGFMFLAAGLGAYAVAVFHLVAHAFFKACMFLGAGAVIHALRGEQDLRQMGGLARKMPLTFLSFVVAALAITGVMPGLSGFVSKDAILWNAFAARHGAYAEVFGAWALCLWGVGLLAAGLTSFYVWRLVFLAFLSGGPRGTGAAANGAHEAPAVMTVPVACLALLSAAGGLLNWPAALGGRERLFSWLEPVLGPGPAREEGRALELGLMLVALAVAAAGCFIAFRLFGRGIHPLTRRAASERPWRWLYARLEGRWHVDELYDTVVVRPLRWLARIVFYEGLERRIIDGFVNLLGVGARTLGFIGQLLQSGNVQRYLAVFAVALAILIYGWLLPARPLPLAATPGTALTAPVSGAGR
jgi:NADH-quinone oxidoreductase subunit L